MYHIVIDYETGDSFHTEDRQEFLEYEFESFQTAAENINRIEEHHVMYQQFADRYHAPYKEIKKNYGHERWFVNADDKDASMKEYLATHSIMLVLDNGREFRYSCFWCGYFEKLYGVSLV